MSAPGVVQRRLGRYLLCDELASGGMSTVHLGRLLGPVGFARTVAIKRAHDKVADEPEFARMLIDEGRLVARIQHPNVVHTLDVVAEGGELFLIMEYVHGEPLSVLSREARERGEAIPPEIAAAVVGQALLGLHAAHEALDEAGAPLSIVHRDVSPHNLLVGADGVTRVLDFGVAKAASRVQTTRVGQIKGKLAYMAPEQLLRQPVDRRTDVFAAGVVLWEVLVGRKLFASDDYAATVAHVLKQEVEHPADCVPEVPRALGDVAMRALARNASQRHATARDMAVALEAAIGAATALRVAAWVERLAGERLAARAERVREIESRAASDRGEARPSAAPSGARGAGVSAADAETATDLSASRRLSQAPAVFPRRRALLAAVLFLGAAGLVVGWRLLSSAERTVPEPASSTAPSSSAPVVTTVATPLPTAVPDTSEEAPLPSAAPSVPSAAAPSAPAVRPRRPPAAAPAGRGCTPPYTVDAHGDKHFKPECFR